MLVTTDYKTWIFVTEFGIVEQGGAKFGRPKQWDQDHTGVCRCISSALSAYTLWLR